MHSAGSGFNIFVLLGLHPMPSLKYMHVNNNEEHGMICCLFPDRSVGYAVLEALYFPAYMKRVESLLVMVPLVANPNIFTRATYCFSFCSLQFGFIQLMI